MKKIFLLIAFVLFVSYFLFTPTHARVFRKALWTAMDTAKDNHLSLKEKKEGWKLLFNGASLDGWRTFQNKEGSWSVADGTIFCHKMDNHHYSDLITKDEYENFHLAVDWKIDPNANSGILYMVTEKYPETYLSGPEYQLLDNNGFAGKVEEYQKCGANYAMEAPSTDATKPIGEWNHTEIIVHKGHVEHWLNEKKVVEYELWNDKWNQEKAAGKWKDAKGYGASKTGHIALQDFHGDGKVWFKSIKIQILQ